MFYFRVINVPASFEYSFGTPLLFKGYRIWAINKCSLNII